MLRRPAPRARAAPRLSRLSRLSLARLAGVLGVAAASSIAGSARASCGAYASACVDSDALWAFGGHSTFFATPSALTVGAGTFGFGIASSLQHNPIVFRTSDSGPGGSVAVPAIGTQLNSTFLFSYGLTDRLQLDFAAPLTWFQDGSGTARVRGANEAGVTPSVARDVRLGAAFAIVPLPRVRSVRGVGVVGRLDVSIPSGDQENFAGDRGFVLIPTLAVEERIGAFDFAASLGARLRKTTALLSGTAGEVHVGSQASASLGVAWSLDSKETWALTAEAFLLASLTAHGASPMQALAGARWAPLWAGDFTLHAGFGGAFRAGASAQLLEPVWRGTFDIRYAPIARDTDGDGILDRVDQCIDEPEDKDGFEDSDGCPDPDNDHDGIADKVDKCPNEPEDKNGIDDEDGCPDPDADGDGIPDSRDKCPQQAEDKEGYQDDDGCPEGGPPKLAQVRCADGAMSVPGGVCDADKDGIADALDVCPLEAEDLDGIVDGDGCPELDADEDGVGDVLDKCPLDAETIDGVADDDGCPEPGARSHVVFEAGAIEIPLEFKPVSFAPGSATVSRAMKAQVAMIAQRAQGLVDRGVKELAVEAWADRAGDTPANRALAQKRADALRAALIATGVPEALVVAKVGDLAELPGKGKPAYLVTARTKRKFQLGTTPAPTGEKHESTTGGGS